MKMAKSWSGSGGDDKACLPSPPFAFSPATAQRVPLFYPPPHLAEKILTSRAALEGERKQVTVLFADIKDSTELIKDLDPEAAQQFLDPAIHRMMDAVHRYEGTVNQVLGDGIMALFGAPIAHEDHALRACYAALAMQAAMQPYAEEVRRRHGGTLRLVEGMMRVNALGPLPVKGLAEPVEGYQLVGASPLRRRSRRPWRAGAGHGQVVALVGEAGVGKSRLVYEGLHSHRTQGWRVLEAASVSYGKATPLFPGAGPVQTLCPG
jgi:class 3 adenylate cyclase